MNEGTIKIYIHELTFGIRLEIVCKNEWNCFCRSCNIIPAPSSPERGWYPKQRSSFSTSYRKMKELVVQITWVVKNLTYVRTILIDASLVNDLEAMIDKIHSCQLSLMGQTAFEGLSQIALIYYKCPRIIIYTQYKLSQLGLGFAWLKTLRTDSPTSGAFMEAVTARGINSKPLREKLQARHDNGPWSSSVSNSTVAAPWILSAVFSVLWTTTHTTNGSSKSYNISKDLPWVFAC